MRAPGILIIDDEDAIRYSLAAFLEDYGYHVVTAPDAESALALLEKKSADAAVVDIRLPGLSGEEFIVRAHVLYDKMVFLVHTGSPEFRLSKRFKALPRVSPDILEKPVPDLTVLISAINRMLGKRGNLED